MKNFVKYVILLILAFIASGWQCQTKSPQMEAYQIYYINNSKLPIKYLKITTPDSGYTSNGQPATAQDSLYRIVEIKQNHDVNNYVLRMQILPPQEELSIYLQDKDEKSVASTKITLSSLSEGSRIDKYLYLMLEADTTFKINIVDVPWEE